MSKLYKAQVNSDITMSLNLHALTSIIFVRLKKKLLKLNGQTCDTQNDRKSPFY